MVRVVSPRNIVPDRERMAVPSSSSPSRTDHPTHWQQDYHPTRTLVLVLVLRTMRPMGKLSSSSSATSALTEITSVFVAAFVVVVVARSLLQPLYPYDQTCDTPSSSYVIAAAAPARLRSCMLSILVFFHSDPWHNQEPVIIPPQARWSYYEYLVLFFATTDGPVHEMHPAATIPAGRAHMDWVTVRHGA